MGSQIRARLWVCALIIGTLWVGGCATYTDILSKTHKAAASGDYEAGIDELNGILGVDSYKEIPDDWTAHRPLAALERGVLLQAQNRFEWSARDFSAAETELEFLDLTSDAVGNIGKYVYSDSAQIYKAQPTERLALNALNMLNYLAMNNLNGAGVEARRFLLSQEYLESMNEDSEDAGHGAFGSYLAGFVFERLGEPDRALRHYEDALDVGNLQAFREPVLRLSARGSYAGSSMEKFLRELEATEPNTINTYSPGTEPDGEILMVLGLGRVPYKVPERMPIGAAIGYAGMWVTGDPDVLAYSALKVVVYPELVKADNAFTSATASLDGRDVPVELITDLDAEITREYERIKPRIIGAALTRMIARAVAAEASRELTREKGKTTSMLTALATEAVLVALDKPDTRSCTFLPARLYVCRARVKSGRHKLRVGLLGRKRETRTIEVEVPPNGFNVVVITEPR
ncbi:MAG: COG3014 family protein [Planctomycetota bacterium]